MFLQIYFNIQNYKLAVKRDLISQKLNREELWIFNYYSKDIIKKEYKVSTNFYFQKKLRN